MSIVPGVVLRGRSPPPDDLVGSVEAVVALVVLEEAGHSPHPMFHGLEAGEAGVTYPRLHSHLSLPSIGRGVLDVTGVVVTQSPRLTWDQSNRFLCSIAARISL